MSALGLFGVCFLKIYVCSGSALKCEADCLFLTACKPAPCIFQIWYTCRDIYGSHFQEWFKGLLLKSGPAFYVHSGSDWGQLWVHHSTPKADPEWTQKANLRFGWGLLSVRLGLVSTVLLLNIDCFLCIIYFGWKQNYNKNTLYWCRFVIIFQSALYCFFPSGC